MIHLKHICPISNTKEYKIHFARINPAGTDPLDVWVKNGMAGWQGWQEYYPGKNEFNKPYIFSLMNFYHEPETWLFGGVFRVLGRHGRSYNVELSELGKEFIARLKIAYPYKKRPARVRMEPHYGKFEVKEILRAPYSG